MIDFFRQFGVKHFLLDSDGSVALLMPEFIDAGLDSLVPTQQTEPNMDPALLRKKFPQIKLIGGIRKPSLAEGEEAIDKALKKAWTAARRQLGFMPVLDGSISPDISWPAFKYFTEQNKLYAAGEL